MSPDRRMDSVAESKPDRQPGAALAQHLGRAESILCIDLPQPWKDHPRLQEFRVDSMDSLPDGGSWDAILRTVESSDSVEESEIRSRLENHRDRLPAAGRLLLTFEATQTPPASWLRLASEIGFLVIYSGPFSADASDSSLLALQRDDHKIRSYRMNDETAILRLFERSFHKERSLDRWLWEYRDNPWSNEKISLAEDPDGQLTTHYAGYGMPFWYHGRTFTALQIGDTMTDPEARSVGRGTRSLLARTVRHFFACHRDRGFGFYYGFNTGPIQRFCRWFIGGMEVEPVSYRWRDAGAPPALRGYRVTPVDRVSPAFDRLFARVAPHYGYLVQRDASYIAWRYLACPDVDYRLFAVRRWGRLVGWGVFKRGDTTMVWGDALFDPKHRGAAASLLHQAWESLGAPDLQGTEVWFPERPSWWHEQLEAMGFVALPNPSKLGFMILPDAETEAPLDALYYSMGDGDLF